VNKDARGRQEDRWQMGIIIMTFLFNIIAVHISHTTIEHLFGSNRQEEYAYL
jgi:hypothetical protein